MFDTVLVAGLGLMGGSMAKTIKARTLSRVLGWNRTRATAEQALADGSIDAIATDALFREVDLVIIGLYPQATAAVRAAARRSSSCFSCCSCSAASGSS